ncbi:hypothetical protein XHV734_4820 [Xanthomonas hortorum pv. vitians]|nr:hypothetical protein XHV734_4820 [Xanthomonas hortorum pv. vitians]
MWMPWRSPMRTSARCSKAMPGGCIRAWMRNCAHAGCNPLLPPGEGAPQGRTRVRAKPLVLKLLQVASPRTLTPTPLPQGEGCSPPGCVGPGGVPIKTTVEKPLNAQTPQTQTPAFRRVFAWMQIA